VWAGRWTFILAATGSTVGLGNVWKFPYLAEMNGGGLFILVYLGCLFAMAIPLMMTQVAMGRLARRDPVGTFRVLGRPLGASRRWLWGGRIGVIAGFLILSFYSVVGGLGLAYVFYSAFGDFLGATPRQIALQLDGVLVSPDVMVVWHSLFLLLVISVSARGVTRGLERSLKVIVPMLLLLMLALAVYASQAGEFGRAWQSMFGLRPAQLSWQSVLDAVGHAFFTLSLGMGAMLIYGAYMPRRDAVGPSVALVVMVDTLVALIAGVTLVALLFASHQSPHSGFDLLFREVPQAFGHLPGGQFLGTVFFIVVSLAAWSSAISVMEPAVSWVQERTGMARAWVVWGVGVLSWAAGLVSIFSFNLWSGVSLLGMNVFGWVNFITASLMLPVAGVLVAIFAGWVIPPGMFRHELDMRHPVLFVVWRWLVRYVVPLAVVLVSVSSVTHFAQSLCREDATLAWCAPGTTVLAGSPGPKQTATGGRAMKVAGGQAKADTAAHPVGGDGPPPGSSAKTRP